MTSIFSKIANHEVSSVIVHEDELIMAIMDINPIQPGQVVVFPKQQISTIWDMSSDCYLSMMNVVQTCGQKLRLAFPEKDRIGVMVEGLEVRDHAHVKLFPFSTLDEFHSAPNPNNHPPKTELEHIAAKLLF